MEPQVLEEIKEENDLEFDFKIIGMFIENAKIYTQFSGGGLAISIIFLREVVGVAKDQPMPLDWLLIISWICFLISIGAGVYYQYLGVKFLEAKSKLTWKPVIFPKRLINRPWPVYLVMMLAFYVGAIFLVASAIKKM
jgi:hypothetical protein